MIVPRLIAVLVVATVPPTVAAAEARASFVEYHDLASWSSAAGPFTTLDFVFPQAVILDDEYLSLGVIFPDAEEVAFPQAGGFPQDGWGVKGAVLGDADIHLAFLEPQTWIGVWFPGNVYIEFYSGGQLVHTSDDLAVGGQTLNVFGGVVSTIPFDEVRLVDPFGLINVDNIPFGAAVPGPGCVLVLVVVPMMRAGRRRHA